MNHVGHHHHYQNGETVCCYKTHKQYPLPCPCCGQQFELRAIGEEAWAHFCEVVDRTLYQKAGVITTRPWELPAEQRKELNP